MLAGPLCAIIAAGTNAVSWVALTYVVASAFVPHCTAAPLTNPVPVTVRVNAAPPAIAELGAVSSRTFSGRPAFAYAGGRASDVGHFGLGSLGTDQVGGRGGSRKADKRSGGFNDF